MAETANTDLAINTGFVAAVAVAFAKTPGFFVPGIGEEHPASA